MPPAPSCCNCNVKSKPHTIPTLPERRKSLSTAKPTRRSQRTVGQTHGKAVVIEGDKDLDKIDLRKKLLLYSQTTKSVEGFRHIVDEIKQLKPDGQFESFDTICRQVANRIPNIREFARRHDLILFVCGKKSSNGRVLFGECLQVNPQSRLVSDISEIDPTWLEGKESIGICGATSTPRWLMTEVQEYITRLLETTGSTATR